MFDSLMFNKYSLYLHRPWEPLKTKNLSLLCMKNQKKHRRYPRGPSDGHNQRSKKR